MSAKLRKIAASKPAYRGASLPGKFLYLHLQTLPVPAGGVMRVSFGQMMEELSMPASWLKKALGEIAGNGLITMSGNLVFVAKGIERISNPNMVLSAIRKLDALDAQSGPIPQAIFQRVADTAAGLLSDKPYLSELVDYALEKALTAPESVAQWDAAAIWAADPEWQLPGGAVLAGYGQSEAVPLSHVREMVQATISATIPAIITPILEALMLRTGVASGAPASAANADTFASPVCQTPAPGESQSGFSDVDTDKDDPFAEDVAMAIRQARAALGEEPGPQDNPVAFLFPVKKDKWGEDHKVFTQHVHNMALELGDYLDIASEMDQMIAYVTAHEEKIPARQKANEYIWNWMRRKHRAVRAEHQKNEDIRSASPISTELNPGGDATMTQDMFAAPAAPLDFDDKNNAIASTLSALSNKNDILEDDATMRHEESPVTSATGTSLQPIINATKNGAENTGSTMDDEAFSVFWAAYPRRVSKTAAMKAWKKNRCAKVMDLIMEDLAYRKASVWHDPQYIPHPSTYLNQQRWEDERQVDTSAFKGQVVKGRVVIANTEDETNKAWEQFQAMQREQAQDIIDLEDGEWAEASYGSAHLQRPVVPAGAGVLS